MPTPEIRLGVVALENPGGDHLDSLAEALQELEAQAAAEQTPSDAGSPDTPLAA